MKQKDICLDRCGPKAGIHIDSWLGKPVKLIIKKQADRIWYIKDVAPKSAPWGKKFSTVKDLVKTEDVEVFGPLDASDKEIAVTKERDKEAAAAKIEAAAKKKARQAEAAATEKSKRPTSKKAKKVELKKDDLTKKAESKRK